MNISGWVAWTIILSPLLTALCIGFSGPYLHRKIIEFISIAGSAVSCGLTGWLAWHIREIKQPIQVPGFTWLAINDIPLFRIGLWVDSLTVSMMGIVTLIGIIVQVYSVTYMKEERGYCRFFSYLSLLSFAMLVLVGSDNCLSLFFGWEFLSFIAYLLIGFWFQKSEANRASLKAFLINRIGDIGLLLGIALLMLTVESLEYSAIFEAIPQCHVLSINILGYSIPILSLVAMLFFIGAMAKSAQMPLQVWLPDSTVGPIPASAFMHTATMVTAGIFLIIRFSPLFECTLVVRNFILIIGATTTLLFGLVTLVQTDIKRVIAFSTISQLGYMTASLGVSAYSATLFHLIAHAFFKALLFLSAGSVILALHHEQKINKMGGLWKQLPITYLCFLIGGFTLIGFPPLSGFYSKASIIASIYQAAQQGNLFANYALYALLLSIFTSALYIGRLLFGIFHGNSKINYNIQEPGFGITLPLVLLAFLSIGIGWQYEPNNSYYLPHWLAWLTSLLSVLGLSIVWLSYTMWPLLLAKGPKWGKGLYQIIASQYGLERLSQKAVIAALQFIVKRLAIVDTIFIDRLFIQLSSRLIRWMSSRVQPLQPGYLHHYLVIIVFSVIIFLLGAIVRA
jgi:NADH-quinone oxidoreductase subunit L